MPQLCIQNNLPNTLTCKNESFFYLENLKKIKNNINLYIMNFIHKLCIQNNLPNTLTYKNKSFFYIEF